MPKANRLFLLSVRRQSGNGDVVAVALFSGIGLLTSLLAVIADQPGLWY